MAGTHYILVFAFCQSQLVSSSWLNKQSWCWGRGCSLFSANELCSPADKTPSGKKKSSMLLEPKVYLLICILPLLSVFKVFISLPYQQLLLGKIHFFFKQFLEENVRSISPIFRTLPNTQYLPNHALATKCLLLMSLIPL